MSLYDDLDADKKSDNVAGWASGIKLFQTHMQLKKATVIQPKRDAGRKQVPATLAPVVNLNSKGKNEPGDVNLLGVSGGGSGSFVASNFNLPYSVIPPKESTSKKRKMKTFSTYLAVDPEWQFEDEYDPLYPNDYEKALRELRDRRDKEAEEEETKRKPLTDGDDDDSFGSSAPPSRGARVEIAPPPSLSAPNVPEPVREGSRFSSVGAPSSGSVGSAAARIMAKYGYKEGQGLGKKEQGMATALQVEKTSFRTGRIIHERDVQNSSIPNPMGLASSMAAYNDIVDDEEGDGDNEPTLNDILKKASKVILLKNMVGPGEVDDDLEPEVKEECQGKYGEVSNVTVFQMPDTDEEEDPIRIFVEFKEVDSAAKALLDLNGRFFGGRQVKASFYEYEKYTNLELTL